MKKISIVILATIALLSCKTLITDDFPDFESLPTVNSIFGEGEVISIHLSLTGGLDSLPLSTIDDATVNLYINGEFNEKLKFTENGIYKSKSIVKHSTEYKCEIIIQGYDTIECVQTLPAPRQIIGVELGKDTGMDDDGVSYRSIKIIFKSDPSVLQYFYIGAASTDEKDPIVDDRLKTSFEFSTMKVITDPVFLNEGLPIPLFSNQIINDSIYSLTYYVGRTDEIEDYSFVVELQSISYDYYCYCKQYYLYSESKYSDITGSKAYLPLYSNITNGYGIFAGFSVSVSDTIMIKSYETNKFSEKTYTDE